MIRKKLTEHSIALLLVGIVFTGIYLLLERNNGGMPRSQDKLVQDYVGLPFINWNSPADRALFKDIWIIYYSHQSARVDSLLSRISGVYQSKTELVEQQHHQRTLSLTEKVLRLGPMYINFIFVYIIVLIFTYYAAQTFGIWRFIQLKRGRSSYLQLLYAAIQQGPCITQFKAWISHLLLCFRLFGFALGKAVGYLILFAPAYVLAYAFKTRFDTDSILFMILLGAFSNGLLVTYTQKFFAFLVAESRKGYLQTALVKNLMCSYEHRSEEGISLGNILRLKKSFPGHVFDHIYTNARYQYLPALKEQASFLITGLIIIEMALNIQNHLCYDLLQNLLYQDYVSVLLASFGIFLIIKSTEVITDILYLKETERYENR